MSPPPARTGLQLTRRGWWFVGSAVVGVMAAYASGNLQLLYAACLIAVLPILAVILMLARRPRVSVVRSFSPRVVQAGSTTTVTLTVSNAATWSSLPATWWDVLPWHPSRTHEEPLKALDARGPRFAARNHTTLEYELTPPRRGIVPVGPLWVEVRDPFGLAVSRAAVGEPELLTVTPEVVPLADTGLSIPAGDGESRLVQRRSVGDDDDVMTREYRSGDAMRRVHWRASARLGDLMVRQEEQRSFPEARIVVDTTSRGYRDADDGESDAFEWVVRMLASVAVHLRRMGFRVAIEETGPAQLDAAGRDRRRTWGDEEFLARLALLHLTDAVEPPARQHGSSGPVFAIAGSPTPATIEWMLAHRPAGEFAVAFVVRSTTAVDRLELSLGIPAGTTPLDEQLEDAGWLVVPVRSADDHAAAWQAVVVELGRSRGLA